MFKIGDIVRILPGAECMEWPISPGDHMRIYEKIPSHRGYWACEFMDERDDHRSPHGHYAFWDDELEYDIFLNFVAREGHGKI